MPVLSAFLIVVTSAWSGSGTRVDRMDDMAQCQQVLGDMKVAGGGSTSVAAYCAPYAPQWWLDCCDKK